MRTLAWPLLVTLAAPIFWRPAAARACDIPRLKQQRDWLQELYAAQCGPGAQDWSGVRVPGALPPPEPEVAGRAVPRTRLRRASRHRYLPGDCRADRPVETLLGPPTDSGDPPPAASTQAGLSRIDLRELRLAYVATAGPSGPALLFAAPAPDGTPPGAALGPGVELSRKTFVTRLSLPASAFWVNLNPHQPDRVTDPDLARTDVARGPRLQIEQQTRFWILPGRILLAGQGAEVILSRAELEVALEAEYLATRAPGLARTRSPAGWRRRSETVSRRVVLPRLRERVNTAPEYAELRQVYAGLILADWSRKRQGLAAALQACGARLGNRNHLDARSGWTPRDTWNKYLQSIENGEYDFTEVTRQRQSQIEVVRTTRYFTGGVELARIPLPDPVRLEPGSRLTLAAAVASTTPVKRDGRIWFRYLPDGAAAAGPGREPVPGNQARRWSGIVAAMAGAALAAAAWFGARRRSSG